ncbi:HTH-type transcriptional regulator CdhR [Mariniflexile rhizosphaerae]|uniref:GlxA family transcriptional regulator n=1 Tax=unclassified Mariniflexile TaxID=2643887 RepID=UPI000CC34ECD|nr:helix-turn-helix domain-containing protein [Mariniflexile sp. TRM1-10]AXP82393.1 HTH-type transcriptional regulator CdhR [Mariniflexile sp. TRM1-10]PLB17680.1 MAG: Transcriptional regulator, AraC family [Flavobacteriaceae bacterium FS1-H7996/R]
MKHISVYIPKGHYSMVNIEGAYQMFNWVNSYYGQINKSPIFNVELIGIEKSSTQTNGLFTINPQRLIKDVKHTDLIIIPAIHGDLKDNLKANAELLPWLVKQYNQGAELVSFCIGTFYLAASGLLNGKPCSTHWQYANEFRAMFPKAILMDDKIMTESNGIYTSGGAYSFTNLMIYLIEKYAGREVAVMASKGFMIDIDRESQSPFMMFKGQKTHKDIEILEAQNYIEQNYNTKITVDELCGNSNVARRTFERRFKKATANTVLEYIQRVKIEAAKKELEHGRKTVNEVMYEVGYNDTKAFRDVFKKITDMTPIDYRNKFSLAYN